MVMPTIRAVTVFAALTLMLGCVPDLPDDEPPHTLEAEFDPSAEPSPKIPTPTDLIYNAEEGRIDFEVEEGDSDIQKDLAEFLNSLDGWPATMPGEAAFLGAVDPESVNAETVRVYDITDLDSPQTVENVLRILEDGDRSLRVQLGTLPTWQTGRRYVVVVLGGENGVTGADGEIVVPSAIFWFFRAAEPLVKCEDYEALEGCESLTELVEDEDAADLEEVRRDSVEVFDALEAAGIPREDIALAWSFRTSSRTVVPFDPTYDDVHFPNDYYMSEDETHLEVPPPPGATYEAEAFLARLNALDGYSLTAPALMRFVGPFAGTPANLTPLSLLFLNSADSHDLPLLERRWNEERGVVELIPHRSLRSHTRYAGVATTYLTDVDGESIIPSHIWAIIRSRFSPVDSQGHSLLDGVSDQDAQDLAEAQEEYAELFDKLENTLAFPREKVAVGAAFTTQSVVEGLVLLRESPNEAGLDKQATSPGGVRDPAEVVPGSIPIDNLQGVVEGTIPGLDLLDPDTREIDGDLTRTIELPFILTLPAAPPDGRTSPPVVIFQHDLYGSRSDVLYVADSLAAEGYAAIAIDLIGHDDRGVCLDDGDCDSGTCADGTCSGGDLRVDTDGLPLNARDVLMPVSRPFAVADAMRQQAVDIVTLTRSLVDDSGPQSIPGVDLDVTDISFFGVGFGAMAGTLFMAVDPTVHVAVLCGPGGNLGQLADLSSEFSGSIDAWLTDNLGLEPGTEAYLFFKYGWSWAADPGDAAVFARHLIDAPLPDPDGTGDMDPRALLVQVPLEDDVIPYEAMRFFNLSVGTELYPEEYEGAGHGFILDLDDPAGILGREQAAAFIASGGGE